MSESRKQRFKSYTIMVLSKIQVSYDFKKTLKGNFTIFKITVGRAIL